MYCKDADRRDEHEVTSFTFLGYEFRLRLAKNRHGKHFVSFLPAVSRQAMKAMGREIRSWHWAKRSDKSLGDLALMFNSVAQGWCAYFKPGVSAVTFARLAEFTWDRVKRWARRKHRRITLKTIRRRYCNGGWWPATPEITLFNPAKVGTTHYRYRGTAIPAPWPATG